MDIAIHIYVHCTVQGPICIVTTGFHHTHSFEQACPDLRPLGVQSNGQAATSYLFISLTDATDALCMSLQEAYNRMQHYVTTPR